MKQKFYAALLCGALMLGLSAPAGAYYMTAEGEPIANLKTQEFTAENFSRFQALGICPPIDWFSTYSSTDFSEGLMLVQTIEGTATHNPTFDYINKNVERMNMNRDRYWFMYDFSEGLAAVCHKVTGFDGSYIGATSYLCYIDHLGNEVIQLDHVQGYGLNTSRGVFTGKFIEGKAVVITGTAANYSNGISVDYAYINKDGEFITEWTHTKYMEEICALPLYNHLGVWIGDYSFGEYKPNRDRWGEVKEGGDPNEQVAPDPLAPQAPAEKPTVEQPSVEQPPLTPTYGQSAFNSLGYTIVGNVGYLNIEVTNSGAVPDSGDLFYVLYNKYKPGYRDNTTDFLPADFIRQIHYDLAPGETKILRAGVGQTGDIGRELTQEELNYGWSDNEAIAASRYVLAQAETEAERDELIAFFKTFHYWEGFMDLSFQPDANGVTILAAPGGTTQERDGLDKKLAAFTSQF